VIFTDNFEGASSTAAPNWVTTAGTPVFGAAPVARGSFSFEQPSGTIARIGRGFTTTAGVTSVKLTWEMYNSGATTSQRYYGQLSSGTAAAPGTGTGGFSRVAANNDAAKKYDFLYSNGTTQTVVTPTVMTVGWHTITLTVIPGAANAGQYIYQIDSDAAQTITSTGAVLLPTNVQLGQTVTNGAVGATGIDAYFDTIKVEQFAPAASKATTPAPADTHTGDDPAATTLGWVPGASNLSTQDILFGTDPTLTAVGDNVLTGASAATNSYNPSVLLPSTTYYWEVVSKNGLGDATTGDIWSFTTAAAVSPEPASLSAIALVAGGLLARRRRQMA
jgi:hypothetical protein